MGDPVSKSGEYPATLQQIVDLIHPDDIDFVIAAEQVTLEKVKEIGIQHQLTLKKSYCCRMRVADGSYHLFPDFDTSNYVFS